MQFIGIGTQDTESSMSAFISRTGVGDFPNVFDDSLDLWHRYGVTYQPAFVFISADGTQTSFGALGESAIDDNIDELF